MVVNDHSSSIREAEVEECHKFETSLDNIASSRPALAISWDPPHLKKENKSPKQQQKNLTKQMKTLNLVFV